MNGSQHIVECWANNSVVYALLKIKQILPNQPLKKKLPLVHKDLEKKMSEETVLEPRESMEFDVVIVGAGPAGLSAAIKLKQLIPDWKEDDSHPFKVPVKKDIFWLLTKTGKFGLPNFGMPPLMNNHGNYIVSLGNVCRWLAEKAEGLGVEIYPGFAAAELIYDENWSNGSPGPMHERGMELHGKYVLFGEGARGSLSKELIAKYDLAKDCEPAKFGIGLKELWEVDPSKHQEGTVQHSFGWPLDKSTGGGSFLYHLDNNQVVVGFVMHLNYKNPYLSPFQEFQRFKTHPAIKETFDGAKRISYGSRAITEGGYQSVPKLCFPGGALMGCAAGFVNVPRIKGSHNAMLSGMLAAEHVVEALSASRSNDELSAYDEAWRESDIGKDLKKVRNVKPLWSKYGTPFGIVLGGIDMWCTTLFGGWSPFGSMSHGKADYESLEPASKHEPIEYPKADGKLTFDHKQKASELMEFAGPSQRYCPAGVYEWVDGNGDAVPLGKEAEAKDATFVINSQNCVHCKTCDIKDPNQNINWTVPQGGEGPVYPNM
ncbi:Electron transfer flavoprotein-ubiquinone oxidoreductase, mitochondrial [Nymphon striatum]|nr:Electron transfer flavoprotein-ubiquinone oxidoreductase, mitochondrial [Nymphon striatum]